MATTAEGGAPVDAVPPRATNDGEDRAPTRAAWTLSARMRASLLGFDAFISYSHADGSRYARQLELRLTERDLACFRDRTELIAGDLLDPTIERALSRSRMLILVATTAALGSDYVKRELAAFSKRKRRIVVIDVSGKWKDSQTAIALAAEPVFIAESPRASEPSDEVVAAVVASKTFAKRNAIARRLIAAVVTAIVASTAVAAWQGWRAAREARQMRANALATVAGKTDDPAEAMLLMQSLIGGPEPLGGVRTAHDLLARGSVQVVLGEHRGGARRVRFADNGSAVISCGDDGTVKVWAPPGQLPTRTLTHDTWVVAIELVPGGDRLLSGTRDGTLTLWDWKTGQRLTSIKAFPPECGGIQVISPMAVAGGLRILVESELGRVRAFLQRADGALEPGPIWGDAQTPILGAAWAGTDDGTVTIVNRAGAIEGQPAGDGPAHLIGRVSAPVTCVAFSHPGGPIAIAAKDDVVLFDPGAGVRATWHVADAQGVAVDARGTRVIASRINDVVLLDPDGKIPQRQLPLPETFPVASAITREIVIPNRPYFDRAPVRATFSPSGRHLVARSGTSAAVYDTAPAGAAAQGPRGNLRAADGYVSDIAWSAGEDRVATAATDGEVRVWRNGVASEPALLRAGDALVRDLVIARDGPQMLALPSFGTAWLHDERGQMQPLAAKQSYDAILAGEIMQGMAWVLGGYLLPGRGPPSLANSAGAEVTFDRPPGKALSGAIARTRDLVALGAAGGELMLFSRSGASLRSFPAVEGGVAYVALDRREENIFGAAIVPKKGWFVSGYALERTSTRDAVAVGDGHIHRFQPLEDGVALVIEEKRRVVAWRISMQSAVATELRLPRLMVTAARFSPDGRHVAVGGRPDIRLWDLATGREATLLGHRSGVTDLSFSSDGRLLASVADTCKVWDVDRGVEVATLPTGGRAVRFAPGNDRVITASDGVIKVWRYRWPDLADPISKSLSACMKPEARVSYLGESGAAAAEAYEQCRRASMTSR